MHTSEACTTNRPSPFVGRSCTHCALDSQQSARRIGIVRSTSAMGVLFAFARHTAHIHLSPTTRDDRGVSDASRAHPLPYPRGGGLYTDLPLQLHTLSPALRKTSSCPLFLAYGFELFPSPPMGAPPPLPSPSPVAPIRARAYLPPPNST